jgi:manganese oxidase
MAEVMPYPKNTIAMKGAPGPFGDYIPMGGLFTILKVRDALRSYDEDPGWYEHPPGTVALKATDEELRRDGVDVGTWSADAAANPAPKQKGNGHSGH